MPCVVGSLAAARCARLAVLPTLPAGQKTTPYPLLAFNRNSTTISYYFLAVAMLLLRAVEWSGVEFTFWNP